MGFFVEPHGDRPCPPCVRSKRPRVYRQGLTDSSFLMLWWWCMVVFSFGEVICLVTPFNAKSCQVRFLFDHFSEKPFTNTPITLTNTVLFSDMPITYYMTITSTVFIFEGGY